MMPRPFASCLYLYVVGLLLSTTVFGIASAAKVKNLEVTQTQAVTSAPEIPPTAVPPAHTAHTLEAIYLYASPITSVFFKENGASYDTLKQHWREYLRPYGGSYREVSRANLLAGLTPGVLVLGSAILLDAQERKAITAFAEAGGSILATWGTGARNGKGQWEGYGFIENLLDMKITGKVVNENPEHFINTFGDGPLSWSVPGGNRIFLGEVAESPLRIDSPRLAARYFDWQRYPAAKNTNGAIAFFEKAGSRRAYFGFSESSWEYDDRLELPKLLDATMAWLRRERRVFKAAWPDGNLSAQLLEMDTEDKYANAINFARHLDEAKLKGTFYSLTSVATKNRDIVNKLAEKHEIAYHAEIHFGFKGKSPEVQQERLAKMVAEMQDIVGIRALPKVTGFRAPTESWDETTEKLLRKIGIRHHVVGPSASEDRLPFFSKSEPGVGPEDALVVLPRTQMDDLNYQRLKLDLPQASVLIALDFDYLLESGALGVLSVHSQNYAPGGLMDKLTPPYIKRLQEHRSDIFVGSGADIESWWRARERVVHTPAKQAATRLVFDVRSPGNVKGVTFFVTHSVAEGVLKAVKASRADLPQPEVVRLDSYRSAIVFRQELKTGRYDYSLEF
ncbi:MAG: hypothetical protein EAZ34_01575 [Polaromonas sp.]|nr:MAG: hypothetical protein EAZ34_01575 [Polaromonas sp.]